MAKWVQSYRDLPLLLNQWANVVRWELPARLPADERVPVAGGAHGARDARGRRGVRAADPLHVYLSFLRGVLGLHVFVGAKTATERFVGAINTMTCEAMMRDGKALQMATSHELGQDFARAFEMEYSDAEGERLLCWTTSWGPRRAWSAA